MTPLKPAKEKLQKFGHILAAVIILLHAYEKFEKHEHSYVFFLVAGIAFLIVALVHHRLAKIFWYADGVFYVIEAIVYSVIAAEYFHLGKRGLPWFYVLATIGYLVAAYMKGKKGQKARKDFKPANLTD